MISRVHSTFTGHETFACRSYWLKKGYDFVQGDQSFNSPQATSILGVGKNMVRSIRFWYHAFGLHDDRGLADRIFNDNTGWDPYLEDVNTIWLLHYSLVSFGYARIYSILFNDFRKRQVEFSMDNFERFLKILEPKIAPKTLRSDVSVLKNNYIRPRREIGSVEDTFTVFLQELNLIDEVSPGIYHFNMRKKSSLSNELILYCIFQKAIRVNSYSFSFDELMYGSNSPGNIFCLTQEELYSRLLQLSEKHNWIVFAEDAGIRELQINKRFGEYYTILGDYYESK